MKKGLPPKIQQALDIVRVIGNNAVHPGQIDLRDDRSTAMRLFELVNLIAEVMITQQKEVEKLLVSWGLDLSGPDPFGFKRRTLAEIENKPLIVLKEFGNNPNLVVERAIEKARIRLKALQIALSASTVLHDEDLLFDLSEYSVLRKVDDAKYVSTGWKRSRAAYALHYNKGLGTLLATTHESLNVTKSFNSRIQGIIERAIYWIGKSIDEGEPDQKVIALCTAMETLLTTKSDKRKGEAISYRMMLLNSLLEESFVDPGKLLWIYELRSGVIHGSNRGEATMVEYYTMLFAARETLYNFIRFINNEKIEKLSQLINKLETSEKVKSLIAWLEKSSNPYAKVIKEALDVAISQY